MTELDDGRRTAPCEVTGQDERVRIVRATSREIVVACTVCGLEWSYSPPNRMFEEVAAWANSYPPEVWG